ncbi:hypothetical protein [Pantoea agglomerans]|uniref:hypothetical protein n=1 Tax=Enterobacter agglomerans TaxID=549 RepID=UPI001BB40B95|nr:hypothetical protein [Pantoea agglomerans]
MPKKAWSDKDLAYIERVAGKVPVPVMAAAINKTVPAVKVKAYSIGLKLRVPVDVLRKHWPEYVTEGSSHA